MNVKSASKISLIASVFLLCGCVSVEFPDVPIRVLDVEHGVCAKYKIIDHERLTVQFLGDFPLIECEGLVGFGFKDYNEIVKPWIRDAIAKLKKGPKPLPQ